MIVRNIVVPIIVLMLIGAGWWFWQGVPSLATGDTVIAAGQPYQHLTYNKLAPDHSGNFTGDVYLLDVAQGKVAQLTKGGTTGKAKWLNNQELLVTYRPKGSVIDAYYLDVTTGRLSVADSQVDSLLFYKEQFESGYSPDRAYYAVQIPNDGDSQAEQYAILRSTGSGAEIINTISTIGFTPPAWLPNSKQLVYGHFDKQVCLLNLADLQEVCRPGISPVVSQLDQPARVAFIEITSKGFQVCTAEIDQLAFSNVQCHDESQQQITDLAWRP